MLQKPWAEGIERLNDSAALLEDTEERRVRKQVDAPVSVWERVAYLLSNA